MNKMSKCRWILTSVLAMIMALCMAFGLAACNTGDEAGTPDSPVLDNSPADDNTDGKTDADSSETGKKDESKDETEKKEEANGDLQLGDPVISYVYDSNAVAITAKDYGEDDSLHIIAESVDGYAIAKVTATVRGKVVYTAEKSDDNSYTLPASAIAEGAVITLSAVSENEGANKVEYYYSKSSATPYLVAYYDDVEDAYAVTPEQSEYYTFTGWTAIDGEDGIALAAEWAIDEAEVAVGITLSVTASSEKEGANTLVEITVKESLVEEIYSHGQSISVLGVIFAPDADSSFAADELNEKTAGYKPYEGVINSEYDLAGARKSIMNDEKTARLDGYVWGNAYGTVKMWYELVAVRYFTPVVIITDGETNHSVQSNAEPSSSPEIKPEVKEIPNITDGEIYGNGHEHHFLFYFNDLKDHLSDLAEGASAVEIVNATVDGEECIATIENFSHDGTAAHFWVDVPGGTKDATTVIEFNLLNKSGQVIAHGVYTKEVPKTLKVSPTEITLELGKTEEATVTATITGKIEGKIAWSTSDNSVADIKESDDNMSVTVTAVAEGTATITANINDEYIATCEVTVFKNGEVVETPPEDATPNLRENNVYDGVLGKCVNIRYECGVDIGAKIANVEASVTKDGVPTNSQIVQKYPEGNYSNYYVHVSVDGDWTCTYEFTLNFIDENGKVIATGTFTKEAQRSLKLDAPTLDLELGVTDKATVTATTSGKVEGEISWTIDNEAIAKIEVSADKTSVTVTAVASGTATITATIDGLTATCIVNVHENGEKPTAEQLEATWVESYGTYYMKFVLTKDIGAKGGDFFDEVKVNGETVGGGWIERVGPWGNPQGIAYNIYVGNLNQAQYHITFYKNGGLVAEFTYIPA